MSRSRELLPKERKKGGREGGREGGWEEGRKGPRTRVFVAARASRTRDIHESGPSSSLFFPFLSFHLGDDFFRLRLASAASTSLLSVSRQFASFLNKSGT